MPLFFFDVLDGRAMQDATGHECADYREARNLAAKYAGELLTAAPDRLWRDGDWTVTVRDASGLQLFSVVIFGSASPVMSGTVWDVGRA